MTEEDRTYLDSPQQSEELEEAVASMANSVKKMGNLYI